MATIYSGAGIIYADDLAVYSSTTTAVQSQGMAARNSLWAVGLVGVVAVGSVVSWCGGARRSELRITNQEMKG